MKFKVSAQKDLLEIISEGGDPRVASFQFQKDGSVYVQEDCDQYFGQTFTKDEFINLLNVLHELATNS